MTGGLGSAAVLALSGSVLPGAGALPAAGALPVAADDALDPQAWVFPEDAGMGPLVIPTIGALPPGSADWFTPGAPAPAVSSFRPAARPADPDPDPDPEPALDVDPGPPAARVTEPPPSAAVRGESRDQAVAPPTHPAPSDGPTAPATTRPPSGPSSSVQPSPATTLPPTDPSPAEPSPTDPSPTDPSPADPSPVDPSPAEEPPAEEPPPVEEPPAEEPPPVEEPPPTEEPPPAEPVPVVLAPGASVEVLDPATSGPALSVTLKQVRAGVSCADASVVPGNGTLVAVRITVTTGADLSVLRGERRVSPGDFRLVADDGSVAGGSAPAGVCDTGAAAFPAAPLAPSSAVTGTVVLDVPALSGTVVFRPAWLP